MGDAGTVHQHYFRFDSSGRFKKPKLKPGGQYFPHTFGQLQKEMDMLNKAYAEVMTAGDAKGRVFTFPIPTYNITKDFDWDNPKYEPILK